MKQTLFVFVLIFSLFSCQENVHNLDNPQLEDQIETRKAIIDCEQDFTPGNIWGDLFGSSNWALFGESGWEGTFEEEYFPCSKIIEDGDCCNDAVVLEYFIPQYLFPTICNYDLDAQELQDLADEIEILSTAQLPVCEDGTILNPIAINVQVLIPLCCTMGAPCPFEPNPCDCYSDYPDDPYWACCQSYDLNVQVKYARTTACRAVK